MPESTYWRTYKGPQAIQITGALQVLLDSGTLGDDEKEAAKKIQWKLQNACKKAEGYTMVPFNPEQDELLQRVEGALWR